MLISKLRRNQIKKLDYIKQQHKNLEKRIKDLTDQVNAYKQENELLRDQNAVKDMLFLDFKERMRDKYLYNTEDEESDYESNEDIREERRDQFRRKKAEARRKNTSCKECYFKAKNESGLKTHVTKKHKQYCLKGPCALEFIQGAA